MSGTSFISGVAYYNVSITHNALLNLRQGTLPAKAGQKNGRTVSKTYSKLLAGQVKRMRAFR